jgi:GT2 family glycosyltransferase
MVKQLEAEGKYSLRSIVPDDQVQDIDACGMAFTLIREPVIKWALSESVAKGIPPFRHVIFGEDIDFVLRAREAGFTAKCDTTVRIAHRGDIGFNGQPELCQPMAVHLNHPFGTTR